MKCLSPAQQIPTSPATIVLATPFVVNSAVPSRTSQISLCRCVPTGSCSAPGSIVDSCISSRIFPAFNIPATYRLEECPAIDPAFEGEGLNTPDSSAGKLAPVPLQLQAPTPIHSPKPVANPQTHNDP